MYKLVNSNVVYRGRVCWCGNIYVYLMVYMAAELDWVQCRMADMKRGPYWIDNSFTWRLI